MTATNAAAGSAGRPTEGLVEGGEKPLDEVAVGGRTGPDPGEPELVHEAVLEGAIGPLAAAAGLRRVAQDMFDAEGVQRAADLSEARAIWGAARGRGVDGPVGAVRVERARQPVAFEHGPERLHDRAGGFAALDELGIEELLRRIVDHDEQRVPGVGDEGEPAMAATVEMQQFPETGPRLAPPPVAAPGAALGHEPRPLEGGLDQRVGEGHAVIPPGQLVEVPDIEPVVPLAIQPEDPLELAQGDPPGRRGLAAAIEQARHPNCSSRARQRRTLRGLRPMTSATWSQVCRPCRACRRAWWIVMARSTAPTE